MTDHDLTQIGIEAFGARRRMQQAIAGRNHPHSYKTSINTIYLENKIVFYFYLDHALASINRYQ